MADSISIASKSKTTQSLWKQKQLMGLEQSDRQSSTVWAKSREGRRHFGCQPAGRKLAVKFACIYISQRGPGTGLAHVPQLCHAGVHGAVSHVCKVAQASGHDADL